MQAVQADNEQVRIDPALDKAASGIAEDGGALVSPLSGARPRHYRDAETAALARSVIEQGARTAVRRVCQDDVGTVLLRS